MTEFLVFRHGLAQDPGVKKSLLHSLVLIITSWCPLDPALPHLHMGLPGAGASKAAEEIQKSNAFSV